MRAGVECPTNSQCNVSQSQIAQVTEEEYADSTAAIKRSLAQAAAGELEDVERFFERLERQADSPDCHQPAPISGERLLI
jgi:hypothetical protein